MQVPLFLDCVGDYRIACCPGDNRMERSIGPIAELWLRIVTLNLLNQVVQLVQLFLSDVRRRKSSRLTFEKETSLCELEASDTEGRRVICAGQSPYIGSGSNSNFDKTLNFQRDHRLANDRSAY